MQRELEENEKSIAELTEQLKKLEDEAGEIMKDCQEAEVGTFHPLWLFYISSQEKKKVCLFVFFVVFALIFFSQKDFTFLASCFKTLLSHLHFVRKKKINV